MDEGYEGGALSSAVLWAKNNMRVHLVDAFEHVTLVDREDLNGLRKDIF